MTLIGNRLKLGATGAPVVSRSAAGRRGFVCLRTMRRLPSLLLASVLAGCTLVGPATSTLPPLTPTETRRPSLISSPTPTLTRGSTATATPVACLREPGEVIQAELVDPALTRSLPYRIYLPPCYGQSSPAVYPTLYMLHGLQSTDAQWDDLGLDEAADGLIASGQLPPFLIVMPWERRGVDYTSAIPEVLVPAIERMYAADPRREARALGGLSRGAGWALRIGLQNPDLFASLGLHSPAVLSPDLYYIPAWLQAIPSGDLPRLWIDIGERDPLRPSALELAGLLDAQGAPYAWHLFPGTHEPAYWTSHLAEYLRWYAADW